MELYIHRDGQQYGPYSVEQAREYLAAGSLLATDLAWHEGAADWVPLLQVEGIVPVATPPSAPTPVQSSQPAWIPPRRTGNSSSVAATSAQAPQSTAARKIPSISTPAQSAPGAARGKVVKTSRRSSSNYNPITQRQRSIGARNMGIGGLFFVGGLAVTAFSYEAAAESPGGGHYFLAWGAILFGGIQFVKGLIQVCKA